MDRFDRRLNKIGNWMGFEQKNWYMDGFEHENLVHGWVGQPDTKSSICIGPNTKYPPGFTTTIFHYRYSKGAIRAGCCSKACYRSRYRVLSKECRWAEVQAMSPDDVRDRTKAEKGQTVRHKVSVPDLRGAMLC